MKDTNKKFLPEYITNCATDFSDYDFRGQLRFTKYFELFEQARFEFARSVGLLQWNDKDIFFPVINVECSYIKPIGIINQFYICTYVEITRFNKFTFYHEVIDSDTHEKYAFATTVVSMVSKSNGMSYLLDEKLYDKIKYFLRA